MSSKAKTLGRAVVRKAVDEEVTFLAAGIAYYAFVSMIPLLLLSFVLASLVIGETFAERLLQAIQGILTPTGEDILTEAVLGAGRGGATAASGILLIWSGLRLFRGVDVAFSMVYGVEMKSGFVGRLSNAVIVFLAITLAITGMVVLGTFLTVLPSGGLLQAATPLVVFVTLTIVFLPLYYFLPGVPVTVREALPGAAFAALGWTVLDALFGVYAAAAGQYGVYGVVGGILLLLLWLYVGSSVLILGAVVNVVAPGRRPLPSDVELLAVFREAEDPVLTTAEVADRLQRQRYPVFERLQALHIEERIERKDVGIAGEVWWIPEKPEDVSSLSPPSDQSTTVPDEAGGPDQSS